MAEVRLARLDFAMREIASYCIDNGMKLTLAASYFERAWFLEMLERNGNNRCAVAYSEGLHRNTVARHLQALGIPKNGRGGRATQKRAAKQA